jgi:hypothetical protein
MRAGYIIQHCGVVDDAVSVNVFNYEHSNQIYNFYYSDNMFTEKKSSGSAIGRWKIKKLNQ